MSGLQVTSGIWSGLTTGEEARWRSPACGTHIVGKKLQYKSGHTAVDADEEVHTGEDHIGSAGDLEHKGGWVHERRDRPPGKAQT